LRSVVIVDIETTGFNPMYGDRIIEIGAVKLLDDNIKGVFHSLINPRRAIPPKITELTGITQDMVDDAPLAVDVLPKFVKFIGTDTIVTHNVTFDKSFLDDEMNTAGIKRKFQYYCTLKTARATLKNVPGYKLQLLKEHYHLKEIGDIHRALSDSFVTAQLYLILTGLYNEETSSKLLSQINDLIKI